MREAVELSARGRAARHPRLATAGFQLLLVPLDGFLSPLAFAALSALLVLTAYETVSADLPMDPPAI